MPSGGSGQAAATAGGRVPFVGRREALARLEQVLAQARAGVPRLVLVEGPGGIGKTALVHRFLTGAGAGCVLHASGEEGEASLEFDEAVRLRHRARAASGPDAALAGELARLGRRQAVAGAWVSAAEHLSSAARLTPDQAEREQFTLEATECRMLADDVGDPAEVRARLRAFAPSGWRSYILGRLAYGIGALDEAGSLLRDAWQRCDPDADPPLGARIAGHFALLHGAYARSDDQAEWAERALRLAPDQTATDMVRYLWRSGQAMSGRAETALAALAGLPDPTLASAAELEELLGRGMLRLCTDDLDGALRDVGGVLAASHDRSAMFRWVAAGHLAIIEFRAGRWDDAQAHGELALSIATDADQPHGALYGHLVTMRVPAARGEWETAESHVRFLEVAATSGIPYTVRMAAQAQAQLARVRGTPEAVIAAFEPLLCPDMRYTIEKPWFGWWIDPLFDAMVTVGDHGRLEDLLGSYEAWAADGGLPSALATIGRARGALAAARGDNTEAELHFEAALVHAGRVAAPFERAVLQLAYGRFLRRAGQRTRAGEQLQAAREVFARLGARPDLDRCEQELDACGLAPGPRRRRDAAALTPQERAVARLVADGLTNRQVARELVVSVKTVEYHLGHVYAKLAVTSRSRLAAVLAGDTPPLR